MDVEIWTQQWAEQDESFGYDLPPLFLEAMRECPEVLVVIGQWVDLAQWPQLEPVTGSLLENLWFWLGDARIEMPTRQLFDVLDCRAMPDNRLNGSPPLDGLVVLKPVTAEGFRAQIGIFFGRGVDYVAQFDGVTFTERDGHLLLFASNDLDGLEQRITSHLRAAGCEVSSRPL